MKKEFLPRFLIWIGIIGVAISLSTRSWILENSVEFMDYSKLIRYLLWWFDHAMRIFWSNLLVFTALDLGGKLSIFLTILLFMYCMCLGIYVSGGLGRHLSYRKLLTVACMPIVIIIIIYAMKVFNLIPRNDRGLESAFLMTFLSSSICLILMNRSMLHNILGVSIVAVFSAVSFCYYFLGI